MHACRHVIETDFFLFSTKFIEEMVKLQIYVISSTQTNHQEKT